MRLAAESEAQYVLSSPQYTPPGRLRAACAPAPRPRCLRVGGRCARGGGPEAGECLLLENANVEPCSCWSAAADDAWGRGPRVHPVRRPRARRRVGAVGPLLCVREAGAATASPAATGGWCKLNDATRRQDLDFRLHVAEQQAYLLFYTTTAETAKLIDVIAESAPKAEVKAMRAAAAAAAAGTVKEAGAAAIGAGANPQPAGAKRKREEEEGGGG